jgi:hypothetical protein
MTASNVRKLIARAAMEMLHKPFEPIVQDQGLADIVVRAETDPDALSKAEWQRYSYLLVLRYDGYEHAYYAHKDGEIRKELWEGIENGLGGNLASNKRFANFGLKRGYFCRAIPRVCRIEACS